MNITKEGWAKIIGAVLLAIATIAGTLLGVDVQLQNAQENGPVVGSQAITERINLDSFGDNTISNGGDLTFYSGNRTGQTIKLTGDTGAIEATTLTVTSLVSQVVSFAGEDGNITDTLLVETLTVTGTASTAGLTSSGGVTGTNAVIGGGYGSTGCDITSAGILNCNGAANIDGATTITGALTVGGGYGATGCTLSAAGVLQCNGAANIDGVLTLGTNMIHSSASVTPTNGELLTPTAKLVTLTPAGAVGVELGACTTGVETVLYNSVNANVVITDTGNGILAGNQTLGQYDALRLSCYNSKWVQESAVSAN